MNADVATPGRVLAGSRLLNLLHVFLSSSVGQREDNAEETDRPYTLLC